MKKILPIDVLKHSFAIHRDLSVSTPEHQPGPPVRIDGMSVGIITMTHDAPHNGEMHPDGDEILYVISGALRVIGDSAPDSPLELRAGDACIIKQGEWHKVHVLDKTQMLHITAGPNGDHRPL
ncbi:MAG: cupin domain-containing protein [Pseudomonadota bacterium]